MNLLMPMAGEGSRTKGRSSLPKPLIPVLGAPMFHWAVSSANVRSNKIFIVRTEMPEVKTSAKNLYPESRIVNQIGKVNGAVLSCLLAESFITNDPLLVMDCDMRVTFDYKKILEDDPDIGVVTFNSQSPSYSYISKDGFIVEKEVVSSLAVAGSFYWRRGSDFVKYAKAAVKNSKGNEVYISAAINEAVTGGLSVTDYTAESAYDLSTEYGTKEFIDDFCRQNLEIK